MKSEQQPRKQSFTLENLLRNTGVLDVADYVVTLAVVLVMVVGMARSIGANASIVFSQVGTTIQ